MNATGVASFTRSSHSRVLSVTCFGPRAKHPLVPGACCLRYVVLSSFILVLLLVSFLVSRVLPGVNAAIAFGRLIRCVVSTRGWFLFSRFLGFCCFPPSRFNGFTLGATRVHLQPHIVRCPCRFRLCMLAFSFVSDPWFVTVLRSCSTMSCFPSRLPCRRLLCHSYSD